MKQLVCIAPKKFSTAEGETCGSTSFSVWQHSNGITLQCDSCKTPFTPEELKRGAVNGRTADRTSK